MGGAFCALLLATSVLAVLRPLPLHAQETGLRGTVSEPTGPIDQQPVAKKTANGQTQPAAANDTTPATSLPAPLDSTQPTTSPLDNTPATSLPASAGAVPDDADPDATDEDGNLVNPPQATDDPSAGQPATTQPRARTTAKQRPADTDKAKDKTKAADKKTPGQTTDATTTGTAATDTTAGDTDQDSANRRALAVDNDGRQKLDPGAERTNAIEGPKKTPEADPFAAPGIKVGSFVLRPTLEQGFTASSNANGSNGGKSAVLSETELRFSLASDWRENSAVIEGNGNLRDTVSGQKINEARGRLQGTLNVDLDNELRAIAKLGYEIAPESASSPDAIAGVTSQPNRQTIDGSLAVEKDVGKLRFALTGAVSHDIYGDAKLTDGTILSQKDRDSTLYTATLRTGYEISPAITPFAEIELGRRAYDLRTDTSGFERSSTRLGARAGVELDMGEKLTGEFSAGWLREAIDDDRLEANSGATVNADLKWSPERGTIIGLTAQTTVEGTTAANESGDIVYSGRLTGERQIRADLTGNAALGLDWRNYTGSDGHDMTLSAEAGLTWWLNRYVGLTSRARTERLTSNLPGRDYTANSVYLGLKLQR